MVFGSVRVLFCDYFLILSRERTNKQHKRQARFHSTLSYNHLFLTTYFSSLQTRLPAPIEHLNHVLTSTQVHKLSATAVVSGARIANEVVSIRSYKVPVHGCTFSLKDPSPFHSLLALLFPSDWLQRKLACCPSFPFSAEQ